MESKQAELQGIHVALSCSRHGRSPLSRGLREKRLGPKPVHSWIAAPRSRITPKEAAWLIDWASGIESHWSQLLPELMTKAQFFCEDASRWWHLTAMKLTDTVDRSKPEVLMEMPLSLWYNSMVARC